MAWLWEGGGVGGVGGGVVGGEAVRAVDGVGGGVLWWVSGWESGGRGWEWE